MVLRRFQRSTDKVLLTQHAYREMPLYHNQIAKDRSRLRHTQAPVNLRKTAAFAVFLLRFDRSRSRARRVTI